MEKNLEESRVKMIKKISEIFQEYKRKKKWKQVLAVLSAFVILITGYTLILPAITMEKKVAMEERIVPMETNAKKEETRKEIGDKDKSVSIDITGKESNSEKEASLNKENEKEEDKNKNQEKPLEKKEEAKADEKKEEKIEEKVEEEKKEEEKEETKKGLKLFTFKDNKNGIKGRAEIKEGQLPDGSLLKIKPIKKEKENKSKINLFSFRSLEDKEEVKQGEDLEKKTKQIEEKISGKIEEILFYDISFFTPEGDYIPVDDQAMVSIEFEEGELKKEEDQEITLIHFEKNKLTELSAQVKKNEKNQVEEITFNTQGFSVFAVIKHSTWTEARIPENEYSIITPLGEDKYATAKVVGDKLENKDLLLTDAEARSGGAGTIRPFIFRDTSSGIKYDDFFIRKKSGNIYTIQDVKTGKYLAINNKNGGEATYQDNEFEFKFYVSDTEPDKVMIIAAKSSTDKSLILTYNKSTGVYGAKSDYNIGEEEIAYHQFVDNTRVYRELTDTEVTNLDTGKYVIVSQQGANNNKRTLVNYTVVGKDYLYSTALKKDGNNYYLAEDPEQANKKIEPILWTITKNPDNSYFIQDDKGSYLTIERKSYNSGILKLVDKSLVSDPYSQGNKYRFYKDYFVNGDVEFYSESQPNLTDRKLGINLRDGVSSWYAYSKGVSNNRLRLAEVSGETIVDKGPNEEELVQAIIPDGDYIIADKNGNNAMTIRKASVNQVNSSTRDENNSLKDIRKILPTDSVIYNIKRNLDGTYTITGNGTKIRIKDDGNSNGYSGIDLDNNGKPVRIATPKESPNLFYIYNDIGSVQFDGFNWRSKSGALGEPLRLYKVTNKDENNNIRFIHQENMPTEKLANIPDGEYIIGNSPNINGDFENDPNLENFDNKQIINTLPENGRGGWNPVEGWIHYNEKATNDNTEYHTIEEKDGNALSEWEFIQTDQPGHYYIKRKGQELFLNLNGLVLDVKDWRLEVNIYKDEERVDQVLITQGNYRLRFEKDENNPENSRWRVVLNSEPLTDADYHYLGKKSEDYLNFKLTNPEEGQNEWLNNVRLMEKILVDNLDSNLKNNIPKGFYQELGPIGKIYDIQYAGEINPYTNLYRMSQKKDGLPNNLTESLLDDHYKEYDLIGWEITLDGTSYVIDKDAEFVKRSDGSGIEISGDKVTVDGVVQTEKLFIPYGNENPLTTKWRELSGPLYFEFNYSKGIMDLERAISVEDLLARETSSDIVTPVLAMGRLFYGQDLPEADKALTSSITMNNKIKGKFRSDRSLIFDVGTTATEENLRNQVYIERVVDKASGNSPSFQTSNFPITDAILRENSIDWLRESDNILSILKKSIDGGKDVNFQPDKGNINIDNYDIDFIWIDRKSNGSFLKGIVYGDMTDLAIEKQFENIDIDDIDKLKNIHQPGNDKNPEEKFNIQIKVDPNRGDAKDPNRSYNEKLYILSFNGGDTSQSSYPQVGDAPLSYNEIQRVNTIFDRNSKIVRWRARVFKDEFFQLEERGVDLKDYKDGAQNNLYSRIKAYKKTGEDPVEQIDALSYATEKLESIKSPKEGGVSLAYTTEDYDLVNFDNLYSTVGIIFLRKIDNTTGQPLKGIKFQVYKDGSMTPYQEKTTLEDGSLIFTDLAEGKYFLREVATEEDIYQDIPDFEFSIVKKDGVGQPNVPVYNIDNFTNTGLVEARAGTLSSGDRAVNYIVVKNTIKTDINALQVEKSFENLTTAEFEDIIRGKPQGDNFAITLEGTKDGKTYKNDLTFDNANIVVASSKKLIWYVTDLQGANESLNLLDMDEISISESNEEHPNYPIVKRRAFFNGEERNFHEYPYKLKKENFLEENNKFTLTNTYTDTFELAIQVEGRNKEYKNYRAIKGMKFKLYGDLDEAGTVANTIDIEGSKLYQLDKPDHDGNLKKEFTTNENGIERITKLAYYEGNKYALDQSYNPSNGIEEVYQGIEDPFIIELVNVNGKIQPVIKPNSSVKGEMEWDYQNGILVLRLRLDRTNYRLPETGGMGTPFIRKMALAMILVAGASLIYRKKSQVKIVKGEKK